VFAAGHDVGGEILHQQTMATAHVVLVGLQQDGLPLKAETRTLNLMKPCFLQWATIFAREA
jgi:hypothetical protein